MKMIPESGKDSNIVTSYRPMVFINAKMYKVKIKVK